MKRCGVLAFVALTGFSELVYGQSVAVKDNVSIPLSFYDGVVHPLTVTHHVLTLLAMGLLAGRLHAPHLDRALFTGLGCVAIGSLLAPQTAQPYILPVVLALSLVATLAVIIDKASSPWLAMPVIGIACLNLGLDTPIEPGLAFGHQAATWAGVLLGTSAPLIYPALITRNARQGWQLIGVRIAASWLSAVALVVLVLRLKTG